MLVRPLGVVLRPKSIEGPLLRRRVVPWWTDSSTLERPVHAFVGAVLLRPSRVNALVLDPEAHPPDVELREAVDAAGGKGHPVVGANRPRKAIGPEGALEDRPCPRAVGGRQPEAGQQEARVLVRDRERIAGNAIARRELAFEVGGPEIVGFRRGRRDPPRVLVGAPPPPLRDETSAGQQIADRTDGGPRAAGVPRPEIVQELASSPVGMLAARGAEERGDLRADAVGAVVRGTTPVDEAATAILLEALQPLVAGLAADAIVGTELGHGVEPLPLIGDERGTLVHGCGLHPGHRPISHVRGRSCSLQECHPCSRIDLLPMYPVCTPGQPNTRSEPAGARRARAGARAGSAARLRKK